MKLLDQLVEERAEISEAQEGIVVRAADEARDLSESEDTNLKDLATRATALDERITELRAVQVANLEAAKLQPGVHRIAGVGDQRQLGGAAGEGRADMHLDGAAAHAQDEAGQSGG